MRHAREAVDVFAREGSRPGSPAPAGSREKSHRLARRPGPPGRLHLPRSRCRRPGPGCRGRGALLPDREPGVGPCRAGDRAAVLSGAVRGRAGRVRGDGSGRRHPAGEQTSGHDLRLPGRGAPRRAPARTGGGRRTAAHWSASSTGSRPATARTNGSGSRCRRPAHPSPWRSRPRWCATPTGRSTGCAGRCATSAAGRGRTEPHAMRAWLSPTARRPSRRGVTTAASVEDFK